MIGNLGKNPEIVTFPQETHRYDGPVVVKKAIFPLATTEILRSKDGIKTEQTEWHNVVCWRGLADVAERKLRKGTQIYVEGKLQSRSWEDKDGNKRYVTEVVAENFTVLGNRARPEDQNNDWSRSNGGNQYGENESTAKNDWSSKDNDWSRPSAGAPASEWEKRNDPQASQSDVLDSIINNTTPQQKDLPF